MTAETTQILVVTSGDLVSPAFSLRHSEMIGISVPTITSAQAFLQVTHDPSNNASQYYRVRDPYTGSPYWTWDLGPGSAAAVITEAIAGFPQARLEFGATQTVTASLAVFSKA